MEMRVQKNWAAEGIIEWFGLEGPYVSSNSNPPAMGTESFVCLMIKDELKSKVLYVVIYKN